MVTHLSSQVGPGPLFACQKWPKMVSYWGKRSQMCRVMCYVRRWQPGPVSRPGHCRGETSRTVSRESSLEEWTCSVKCNVICNASWHNVLFDSPEVADLHCGSQRCWSSELYLRSRDAESEKRRVWAMLPDSSARVPCCWWRPRMCRVFSSSIQQPGGAPRVATGKVRWEEALFSLFIVAIIVFCSPTQSPTITGPAWQLIKSSFLVSFSLLAPIPNYLVRGPEVFVSHVCCPVCICRKWVATNSKFIYEEYLNWNWYRLALIPECILKPREKL